MPSRTATSPALAYAGLGATTICWAAAFVAGKRVLVEMTPLAAAACRYALAAAALLPFAVWCRPRAGIGRSAAPLAVMVVAGGVLYPWLFLLALARTSATNTALLLAINPVITLLLAPLVGERLDARRAGGIGLALAGAATVITRGEPHALAALSFAPGDLLAAVAAAVWATFNLASRGVVGRLEPPFVNCVVYGTGALALWGLGWGESPGLQLARATPPAVGGLAVMALLSSALAGHFFLIGIRTLGVGRTVVFVYLVPVLTGIAAVALLGEQPTLAQGIGGAAVLGGVALTSGRARYSV
jgi:drug/metabolite transporter (DMT)-like permease